MKALFAAALIAGFGVVASEAMADPILTVNFGTVGVTADSTTAFDGTRDYNAAAGVIELKPATSTFLIYTLNAGTNDGVIKPSATSGFVVSSNLSPSTPTLNASGSVTAITGALNSSTSHIIYSLTNLTTNGLLTFNTSIAVHFPSDNSLLSSNYPKIIATFYIDNGNHSGAAGQVTQVTSMTIQSLTAGGGNFSLPLGGGQSQFNLTTLNPYSMTVDLAISGLDSGQTIDSIDARFSVAAIPEPMSLALLGSGLIGLGLARRKRA